MTTSPDPAVVDQVRALITGLAGDDAPALYRLGAISQVEAALHACRADTITTARDAGDRWADIGQALGMTGQSAGQWWRTYTGQHKRPGPPAKATTQPAVKEDLHAPVWPVDDERDEHRQALVETPPAPPATSDDAQTNTAAAPEPEPMPAAPITGAMSSAALLPNTWGGLPEPGSVHYHDDGPLGTALTYMGPDARLDVDGDALANVVGAIATDVTRGRRTAQQGVDAVTALRDRLPETSRARRCLDGALRDMDAPMTPLPTLPEGTPEPLRQLVHALHAVPMVRAESGKELEPLLEIVAAAAAGRTRGRRLARDLRSIRNKRHESLGDCGKFEIDRAVDAAAKALDDQ